VTFDNSNIAPIGVKDTSPEGGIWLI